MCLSALQHGTQTHMHNIEEENKKPPREERDKTAHKNNKQIIVIRLERLYLSAYGII